MNKLDWWDKFRFSFYTALGVSATQVVSSMVNSGSSEMTDLLWITTAATFVIHYTATSNKFIQEKIDTFKKGNDK